MLVWDDAKYASGVREVDDQHKQLFSQVNKLLSAMREGRGKEEIGKIVGFLERYVVDHFSCEERHMERTKCRTCAANKAAHKDFLTKFGAIKAKFEKDGPSSSLSLEIQGTLCGWLDNHIRKIDTALKETAK